MLCRTAYSLLLLTAVLAVGVVVPAQANPAGRRFVATGPDNPTPATFRNQLAEFEKHPFDGAVILPTRRLADGTLEPADFAFSRQPWQPAEIEAMVTDLKESKPTRARDNFLAVQAQPGDVDWFDDTGWRETVDHWRLLARAAKLGGLRGLAFEPAPSGSPGPLFNYQAQAKRQEKDFAAYAKVARDRGRDVMLAVATEFPEAVILCHGLYSEFLPLLAGDASPASLLPTHPWGLLPAFLDGWWDAAPPKLQIVDGNEAGSRLATSDTDFNRVYTWLRTQSARLAAPEHRAKLKSQLLVGHGQFLDTYLAPRAVAASRSADPAAADLQLTSRAAAALRASDGWIWVDGQTARWWPPAPDAPAGTVTTLWPDAFPGVVAAIARVRTPAAAARERLAIASPAENRLANGDFAKEGRESLPASWWTWQRDDSRGTARRDVPVVDANRPASASWTAAAEAHFGQEVAVKVGEIFAVGMRAKASGQGVAALRLGWKDAKGQWTATDADVIVPTEGTPDADGWHEVATFVRAPPGAAQLVVMLGVHGQLAADDRIVFSRAMAVRL